MKGRVGRDAHALSPWRRLDLLRLATRDAAAVLSLIHASMDLLHASLCLSTSVAHCWVYIRTNGWWSSSAQQQGPSFCVGGGSRLGAAALLSTVPSMIAGAAHCSQHVCSTIQHAGDWGCAKGAPQRVASLQVRAPPPGLARCSTRVCQPDASCPGAPQQRRALPPPSAAAPAPTSPPLAAPLQHHPGCCCEPLTACLTDHKEP